MSGHNVINQFSWKPLYDDAPVPTLAYPGTAQYELRAYLLGTSCAFRCGDMHYERGPDTSEDPPFITFLTGEAVRIPLGITANVPEGLEVQIRPLDDLSFERGLEMMGAPATIHAGFSGEWSVTIGSRIHGRLPRIEHGMRIAQAVLARTVSV